MAKFTCTEHSGLANKVAVYWQRQTEREIMAEEWFMAALSLGSALEAVLYAYFIIWSGDDGNDPAKDYRIPSDWGLFDLIKVAKLADLMVGVKFKDEFGEHAVENVINDVQHMRNNIHAGVALKNEFDPAKFPKEEFVRLYRIMDAFLESWEKNL